jgi:hypothetical protein
MSKLFVTNPSRYLHENKSLCEALQSRDLLDTQKRVHAFEKFWLNSNDGTIIIDDKIIGLVSRPGTGKSFYLGLLYCSLYNQKVQVYYMDVLKYIAAGKKNRFFQKVKKRSQKNKEEYAGIPVILIDNVEKQPAEHILDFFYTLRQYAEEENVLYILAYDYNIIQRKLNRIYGEEYDVNLFFQKYLDMEFYLREQMKLDGASDIQAKLTDELENGILSALLIELYEQKYIDLTQIGVLVRKIKYFKEHFFKEEAPTPAQMNTGVYLILLKLICKEAYEYYVFSDEKYVDKCGNVEIRKIKDLVLENGDIDKSIIEEIINILEI